MKKTPIFGLIMLVLMGIVATTAFAMPFGVQKEGFADNEMRLAFGTGDFETYIESFDENDRPFMRHKMTEEQFEERAQRRNEMLEKREAVTKAIESGNYDIWFEAIEDSGRENIISEIITSENFGTLKKLHEAKQDNDWETASSIAKELGLGNTGSCVGKGMRGGFRSNSMMGMK